MTGYRRSTLALAGLVALVVVASACTKPASQLTTPATTTTAPSDQSGSSTASGSSTTKPAVASTEIMTPSTGSAQRKALLDAARTRFSTTSEYKVYQLYVLGDTAVGEISSVDSGKRSFVAWADGPKWAVVWTASPGSAAANAKGASAALPSFSAKLIDKIDWVPPGPTAAQIAAKQASLATAAKKWSKTTMNSMGEPYKVTLNKVAIDTKGVWWGHVVTQPTNDSKGSYEPLNYWAKYVGGAWQGAMQDPEPPAASSYFPAAVISKLGL